VALLLPCRRPAGPSVLRGRLADRPGPMTLSQIISAAFKIGRAGNTLRAASRGPASLAKQQIRRKVYRTTYRTERRALRKGGL
jgi:hypothetical protein